ncbi:DUF4385 family protein, partial [bacterium]
MTRGNPTAPPSVLPRSVASPYDDPELRATDFRKNPERYRVARGEQGVLTVEPYKSELLP